MDVFYEESAIASGSTKEQKRYKIVNVISNVLLVIWIIIAVFVFINQPIQYWIFEILLFILPFFVPWILMQGFKKRLNVSYDYAFVTGELRISKVFNVNKRKLITRFDVKDILQIGDVDNSSFERLRSDPSTKCVIVTPNAEPAEGKFFMYILASDNGKNLYVLECRESLLLNIMKFANRSVLESDYVMQEKKQQRK